MLKLYVMKHLRNFFIIIFILLYETLRFDKRLILR